MNLLYANVNRKLLAKIAANANAFRQPFDLPAITNTTWQRERPPELIPATFVYLAPQVGLEPTTLRLTAECSAIELLRNKRPHIVQTLLCAGREAFL